MPVSASVDVAHPLDVVVLSPHQWDSTWRRNQFLVRELLRRRPKARVLFVEPTLEAPRDLLLARRPPSFGLRAVEGWERLWALRPLAVLPRRLDAVTTRTLRFQVHQAIKALRFARPVLWVSDDAHAGFAAHARWPLLYDVTGERPEGGLDQATSARHRHDEALLMERAAAVVVTSPSLASSRGAHRPVSQVRNAVDVEHFRRWNERPGDLPESPCLVSLGTLHEQRLDVGLCEELAESLAGTSLVLVGPIALEGRSLARLRQHPNVSLLGPRPYHTVPAYLQHADVVVVPEKVTAFTDSLDPIKAYECLATGRPTVATPVAGFAHLGPPVEVVERSDFVDAVEKMLVFPDRPHMEMAVPTWAERGEVFADLLEEVSHAPRPARARWAS